MIAYIEQNTEVVNVFKSKSRERVLKNYTWEKIANQYYTLFELISSQKTGELKKIKTSKFPVNLI
jgi:glycosyltransferase involved in cell wall biosynthesis